MSYNHVNPTRVLKAKLPKLACSDDAYEAFKKIARKCIRHLQGNQEAVLHGTDVEGVHQMRIALRRLRSAFSLFRNVLEKKHTAKLRGELTWLAGILGKARDLDVLVTETLPVVLAAFDDHAGLLEFYDKALIAQIKANNEVRVTLSSQRYHKLLSSLTSLLERDLLLEPTYSSRRLKVLSIATATLAKRHKQLHKHDKSLARMNPAELHSIRITVKKQRYTAEFFASLYHSEKSRTYIDSLSRLQDLMGELNDINIAEALLPQLAGPSTNHLLDQALRMFSNWKTYNTMRSLTKIDKVWHKLITKKPFWV